MSNGTYGGMKNTLPLMLMIVAVHLHGVKEEEHDEEGDGGAEGEAHCLHTVQGRHTVLSPEKWNLYIDSQQNLFVFLYVRI